MGSVKTACGIFGWVTRRYLTSLGADKYRLNGALTTSLQPRAARPDCVVPHRTQHDQRRGFAVEHRDPPIPETVPPKVPRRLVTALSAGHAGAIAAMTSSSPVGLAWTLRWVWGAMRL